MTTQEHSLGAQARTLKGQADALQSELDRIRKRISEMEAVDTAKQTVHLLREQRR